MNIYKITIDGVEQPGEFATEAEANEASMSFRASQTGRAIIMRQRPDPQPAATSANEDVAGRVTTEVTKVASDTPAAPTAPAVPRSATIPPNALKAR